MVARERAAGAIGAVHAGCEADHQEPMTPTPERLDGPAVVGRVRRLDRIEVSREPGTEPAKGLEGRPVHRLAAPHLTAP
jgi:hypothetical protein